MTHYSINDQCEHFSNLFWT